MCFGGNLFSQERDENHARITGPVGRSLEGHGPQVGSKGPTGTMLERVVRRTGWGSRRADVPRRGVAAVLAQTNTGERLIGRSPHSPNVLPVSPWGLGAVI